MGQWFRGDRSRSGIDHPPQFPEPFGIEGPSGGRVVAQELMNLLYPMLVALALAMARIGAAAYVVPFLGGQVLSGAVRNAVIVGLAIPVVPAVHASLSGTTVTPVVLLGLVAKEAFLGIVIGFLSGIAFWGA